MIVLVIAVAIERNDKDSSMELSENNDMQIETVFLIEITAVLIVLLYLSSKRAIGLDSFEFVYMIHRHHFSITLSLDPL